MKMDRGTGLKIGNLGDVTAKEMDDLLKLRLRPSEPEDLELLGKYGLTLSDGDGLAGRALVELIGQYGLSISDFDAPILEPHRIAQACRRAVNDPEFSTPTLGLTASNELGLSWTKRKLREWLRT